MKKMVLLMMGLLLTVAAVYAAENSPQKVTIKNTRIVQATTQDTTVDYAGIRVFVPQGQTILLGQRSDGMIVLRGSNLNNVKIGDATFSSNGFSVFSYQPESQVVFLNRGTDLTVRDSSGTLATIYPGQAVSTADAQVTSVTAPRLQAIAAAEAALAAEVAEEIPAFVAESETSTAAAEQATQDVEESETVLSNSTR